MGSDHHKGLDCGIPIGGGEVSHSLRLPGRDPPAGVSVTTKELRGMMFYDHRASSIKIHSNSDVRSER